MFNFLRKLKEEHDSIDIYKFEDYYTFDDIEDLHAIVTNKEIPSGVYVHSTIKDEIFLKMFDEQDRIIIGISAELSTGGDYLVATNDGLAVKDNSKVISKSEVENFLVMSDYYGFNEFILVNVTFDKHLNMIYWYGEKEQFPSTKPFVRIKNIERVVNVEE